MIGRPSDSRSLSVRMRVTTSVEPPGGKPTSTRIARVSCASAGKAVQASSKAIERTSFMRFSL